MPLSTSAHVRILPRSHQRVPATNVQVSPAQCKETEQPNEHIDTYTIIQIECLSCIQSHCFEVAYA
eukprot:COSAG02_NODE_786_length_17199_cov_25.278889_7_plen_66_part_00